MLVAPTYGGLELPLYTPETPPLTQKWAMIEAAKQEQNDTFVRAVTTRTPYKMPKPEIMAFLELADQELDLVARLCGSQAVQHSWGQYKVSNAERKHYNRFFPGSEKLGLPADHILVAEVEIIKNALPVMLYSPLYQKLISGTSAYIRQRRPYPLVDFYSGGQRQFVIDPSRLTEGEPTATSTQLVDIDPIF